jgi:hypothetical protein
VATMNVATPCHPIPNNWVAKSVAILSLPLGVYQGLCKAIRALGELNADNGIVGVRLGGFVMTTRSASRASTFGRGL